MSSFHNMALKSVPIGLTVEAYSEDGVIEAVKAKDKEIYGTMWHSERENPYAETDIQFIKQLFSK